MLHNISITQSAIVNPIHALRLEYSNSSVVGHTIKAEFPTRLIGSLASFTAAIDCIIQLTTCVYILLRNMVNYCSNKETNTTDLRLHFSQAIAFLKLTVIGSIAGSIWPALFENSQEVSNAVRLNEEISDLSPKLQQLVKNVKNGSETAPYLNLQKFWHDNSPAFFWRKGLENRHQFIQIFSQDSHPAFAAVRTALASMIYKPIIHRSHRKTMPLSQRGVRWLSSQERETALGKTTTKVAAIYKAASYFHATHTKESLEQILTSGFVHVNDSSGNLGAFVSTIPERQFGDFVIAFSGSAMEHLSRPNMTMRCDSGEEWIGYAKSIPINRKTVPYVLLRDSNGRRTEQDRSQLEEECRRWTRRDIPVVLVADGADYSKFEREATQTVLDLNIGVPQGW